MFLASKLTSKTNISLPDESSYRIAYYKNTAEEKEHVKFFASAKPQVLTPTKFIEFAKQASISSVSFDFEKQAEDFIYFIVTDGTGQYYSYSDYYKNWIKQNGTPESILDTYGTNITAVDTIDKSAWKTVLGPARKIGFAFKIAPQTDSPVVFKGIDITVLQNERWRQATDHEVSYSYPDSETLHVEFLSDGDYLVNYYKDSVTQKEEDYVKKAAPTFLTIGPCKVQVGEIKIEKEPNISITTDETTGVNTLNVTFPKALDPDELPNQLRRNTEYAVGDIAYYTKLPSWGYFYCKTAGTTGETVPENLPKNESEELTDGTAVFVLRNVSYAYGFTENKNNSNVWIE